MSFRCIDLRLRNCARLLMLAFILLAALLLSFQMQKQVQASNPLLPLRERAPNNGDEIEIKGLLLSAPASGAIGEWVIQSEQTLTRTLVSDANTRMDKGIPAVGAWVEAKYIEQTDGTLLATRLRPDDYEAGEVVVRLATGVSSATINSRYQLIPLRTLLLSGHIYLFATEDDDEDVEALTTQLNNDGDVVWAELNYVGGVPEGNPYKIWHWGGTDAAGYTNQFAFQQVNLTQALQLASGAGVTVAILDTGIDHNHPAFVNRLVDGWDMVADDAIPFDEGNGLGQGHGTHVAGIVARMAPDSKLLPVRVLDSNGLGNTFTLAYAIEWAVTHGADVINLSLGAEADSQVLRSAIDYATGQGVVIVAAAGNNGDNRRLYPVAYPGVIGVTAVDAANQKAPFANYGAGVVDLAAPGVGITSTMIQSTTSGYASWSGTSMSTAFVSGGAALVRQRLPTASVTITLQLLQTHGQDLNGLNPGFAGQLGRMLDIGATVGDLTPTPGATPSPTPDMSPTVTATPSPSPTPTGTPGGSNQQHRNLLPLVSG
jgi:thermitase